MKAAIRTIWVVLTKELLDNIRDRRSMAAALLYPLLGPVLLVTILAVVGKSMGAKVDAPLELPVVGAENAPGLIDFLVESEVEIVPAPDEPAAAVRAGDVDLVMILPREHSEAFGRAAPASVELLFDASRQSATITIRRTQRLLDDYAAAEAARRLQALNLDPQLIEPLDLVETDLATPQTQAAGLLNMSGYFLIFSIFIGGMYLAIDSTAGERERGSLEPLLLNPIDRRDLLLGKLAATLVFTFIAAAETLLAFGLVFNLVPLDDFLGLQISLDAGALAKVLLISLPIMPLAASLQLIIASFTRSFKEAQNYLSLLPLAPALPGMFLAFLPVKPSLGAMLVPTYGQQLLINQVMREEQPQLQYVMVSAGSTLLVAGILIAVAVRLYRRERLVFGR